MSGLDIEALAKVISQARDTHAALAAWQGALQQVRQIQLSNDIVLPKALSCVTDALISYVAAEHTHAEAAFFAMENYGLQMPLPYEPLQILVLAPTAQHAKINANLEPFKAAPLLQYHISDVTEIKRLTKETVQSYERWLSARFVAGHRKQAEAFDKHLQSAHWPTATVFAAIANTAKAKLFSSTPNIWCCYGGLAFLKQGALLRRFAAFAGHSASPYAKQLHNNHQQLAAIAWFLQCQHQAPQYLLHHPEASLLATSIQKQPRFTLSTLLEHIYLLTLDSARLLLLEKQFLLEQYWPSSTEFSLINRRFLLRHGYVDVIHNNIFKRWPFAILEMLALPVEEPNIQGFSHQSLALAWANRDALSTPTKEQNYWFLRLIYRSPNLFHALLLLQYLGILEQHIPAFALHKGKLAHSQGLQHPIDVEALFMVQRLQQLHQSPPEHSSSLVATISYHLPQPGLLYIVGLFHHLYRQRSHCIQAASFFCQQHQSPSWEAELVLWLIEHQDLMLNTTAQQDISQPQNIYAFAQSIKNLRHLDYLYLFSQAKLATQSEKGQWQSQHLTTLYHATKKALRRGLNNPVANTDWANDIRLQATKLLTEQAVSGLAIQRLWAQIGDEYFLRETPADIAWHTQAILRHRHQGPLVLLREHLQVHQNGSQVFIYTKDSDYLFATTVKTLEELGLSVMAANIITSAHGFSLDTYTVVDAQHKPITDPQALNHIQQTLTTVLNQPETFKASLPTLIPSNASNNTQVQIANSADGFYTVVALQTQDQPGLLTRVAQVFAEFRFNLHHARIATYGERVEDTFHISDDRGLPLSEAQQGIALQDALTKALG